jgi:hypothetical protein
LNGVTQAAKAHGNLDCHSKKTGKAAWNANSVPPAHSDLARDPRESFLPR